MEKDLQRTVTTPGNGQPPANPPIVLCVDCRYYRGIDLFDEEAKCAVVGKGSLVTGAFVRELCKKAREGDCGTTGDLFEPPKAAH